MRLLFCILLLAWACNRDDGSKDIPVEEVNSSLGFVETPTTPEEVKPAPDPAPGPLDEKTTMINSFRTAILQWC